MQYIDKLTDRAISAFVLRPICFNLWIQVNLMISVSSSKGVHAACIAVYIFYHQWKSLKKRPCIAKCTGSLKNYTMAASNWYERLKSLKEKLPKETKRQPDILLTAIILFWENLKKHMSFISYHKTYFLDKQTKMIVVVPYVWNVSLTDIPSLLPFFLILSNIIRKISFG